MCAARNIARHLLLLLDGLLLALLVGCGVRTDPSGTAQLTGDDSSLDERLAAVLRAPQVAVYDMQGRLHLAAFSDDTDVCARLQAGTGLASSTTVFALVGGLAERFELGAGFAQVAQASMGLHRPVGIVTGQALDDTCGLVKYAGARDTDAVVTVGTVRWPSAGDQVPISVSATLRGGQALDVTHRLIPCAGLLTRLLDRMPLTQVLDGKAAPLRCEKRHKTSRT